MKTSPKALAVVGSIAVLAFFALSQNPASNNATTFLFAENDVSLRAEYQAFVAKVRRNILTKSEFEARFSLFKASVQEIEKINADPSNTFKLAVNSFADLSAEEYKARLGFRQTGSPEARTFYK